MSIFKDVARLDYGFKGANSELGRTSTSTTSLLGTVSITSSDRATTASSRSVKGLRVSDEVADRIVLLRTKPVRSFVEHDCHRP